MKREKELVVKGGIDTDRVRKPNRYELERAQIGTSNEGTHSIDLNSPNSNVANAKKKRSAKKRSTSKKEKMSNSLANYLKGDKRLEKDTKDDHVI